MALFDQFGYGQQGNGQGPPSPQQTSGSPNFQIGNWGNQPNYSGGLQQFMQPPQMGQMQPTPQVPPGQLQGPQAGGLPPGVTNPTPPQMPLDGGVGPPGGVMLPGGVAGGPPRGAPLPQPGGVNPSTIFRVQPQGGQMQMAGGAMPMPNNAAGGLRPYLGNR